MLGVGKQGGWQHTPHALNHARRLAPLPLCPNPSTLCSIKTVRFLHKLVEEAGFRAALLHGERSQEEREAAVADFRSGKAQVRAWRVHCS